MAGCFDPSPNPDDLLQGYYKEKEYLPPLSKSQREVSSNKKANIWGKL